MYAKHWADSGISKIPGSILEFCVDAIAKRVLGDKYEDDYFADLYRFYYSAAKLLIPLIQGDFPIYDHFEDLDEWHAFMMSLTSYIYKIGSLGNKLSGAIGGSKVLSKWSSLIFYAAIASQIAYMYIRFYI